MRVNVSVSDVVSSEVVIISSGVAVLIAFSGEGEFGAKDDDESFVDSKHGVDEGDEEVAWAVVSEVAWNSTTRQIANTRTEISWC